MLSRIYQGEYGLKGFLKAREEQILDIEVSDEGSFLDADTKEEYGRLLQLEGSRGQGYPDGETLRWLLEISKMPEHLRRHSEAVSRKSSVYGSGTAKHRADAGSEPDSFGCSFA